MGGKFGNLIKIKNVVTYSLSPFEQKAFAGFFSRGGANLYRRFMNQIFYVGPAFATLAVVMNYADKEHHHLSRKNPKDFENEE